MKGSISFVDRSRQDEINTLRIQEYGNAKGFHLDLNTLKWKTSDDQSFILTAQINGEIVSTMRGEFIDNLSLLEQKLECPWNFPCQLPMPVLLLSRAATLSSQRAAGWNLILRYWFLRFAAFHGIDSVVGTFVSGSPRENTLRAMGYRFFENELGWQQSTYRSLRPVNVVVLDLKTDGQRAMQYCLDRVGKTIANYPFAGEFPELRIVRCI